MKILFLDLEGVMTIIRSQDRDPTVTERYRDALEGRYSNHAAELVRELVEEHGFKIVLITRHSRNDSAVLRTRLAMAGINPEWLYQQDPDAIPDDEEHKGDAMLAWFTRNPGIKIEDTVALEDKVEQLKGYPADRIVATDPRYGFTRRNFNALLEKFGIKQATSIVQPAIPPQEALTPRAL